MNLSFKNIQPFLHTHQNKASRLLSYIGLGIGVLLLLCSVQMYININELLKEKSPKKDGYDYVSITKKITNDNMGEDNSFTTADIDKIKTQSFIDNAAPLRANKFKVTASAGGLIPVTTDIFVEALQNNFLDTIPPGFSWQPGQETVPIIFSADFLEMYNVLAPSWDLPQLSQETASSVNIFLRCHGHNNEQGVTFKGRIVAFSDRVNSILVPESFLNELNKKLEGEEKPNASRIFIKTKDANNPQLLSYLEQNDYHVNKDKTRFGRVKQILQGIVSGLAGFGILVILLAMVLFSFYLQLMIARSKENLQLLLTLGYSPHWLSKTVAKKWIPVYVGIIIVALLLTEVFHIGFQHTMMNGKNELSPFIHWIVIVVAAVLLVLSMAINFRLVKKLLNKL